MVAEVVAYLVERMPSAVMAGGVARGKIWLDPGHRLRKDGRAQSLDLRRAISSASSPWAFPVLLGASRKGFIASRRAFERGQTAVRSAGQDPSLSPWPARAPAPRRCACTTCAETRPGPAMVEAAIRG